MQFKPLCSRCNGDSTETGILRQGCCSRCLAKDRITATLHTDFCYTEFRPGQDEALLAVLYGRDVFVRMATGAGKSLTMFLAPLSHSEKAVGAVIRPLISLMDEHVWE